MQRRRLAQQETGIAGVSGFAMPGDSRPAHVRAPFSLNLSGNAVSAKEQYETEYLGGRRP